MEFKAGDLVKLKSGGSLMTVESIDVEYGGSEPSVFCVWSEKVSGRQDIKRDSFPPLVLEKAEKKAMGAINLGRA